MCWSRGGLVGWLASSAQHHQEDGPASSPGHLSMGTELCAVVFSSVVSLVFSNLKLLLLRWFRVGPRIVADGVAPVNRGTTESDRERWLPDIQCN